MNKSDFTKEQQEYIERLLLDASISAFEKASVKTLEQARLAGLSRAMLLFAIGLLEGTVSKSDVTADFWKISHDIIDGKPIDLSKTEAATK